MGYIKKMGIINKPMGNKNKDIVGTMLRSPMGKNAYISERGFEKENYGN